MMKYQSKKNNPSTKLMTRKGFTLIEMMVAIAVFSIVMVTAMSALLNVIDANNKARSIKTAINNISFALEGISKDMRMGTEYECFLRDGNCVGIKYKSPRVELKGYAYYKFQPGQDGESGQVLECLEKDGRNCTSPSDFQPITSAEVNLTDVKFYVLGVENSLNSVDSGTKTQPRMIMTISGTAGPANKPKLQTTFDLQTSVSQRIRP